MRSLGTALVVFLALSNACAAQLTGEAALFYERGHYWIEIAFHDSALRDTIPPDCRSEEFEITKLGTEPFSFRPAKAEIVPLEGGTPVVVLSSSKLEGRACYRVRFERAGFEPVVVDSICDPFYLPPGAGGCGGKAWFRKHVASAFQKGGDVYDLDQFAYGYDFSAEKSVSTLSIAPRVRAHGLVVEPSFRQGVVDYSLEHGGSTSTDKRYFGLDISKSLWAKGLRVGFFGGYLYDRSTFRRVSGDSTIFAQSLAVEGRIGFDNLFDHLNRYCLSVFKGIDLGFGYAWYQSSDEDVWRTSDFERTTPFVRARATWTFLGGFQLSYSLLSFWPTSIDDTFEEFQSLRFRLLLRDALPAQAGKAYHPDVELAYDRGKRVPLFIQEEKVSLGFTFGLYPW